MSAAGSIRTPKNQRPPGPYSEASNIPRPKLESTVSDATTSLSASRAKQSKRDEVCRELREAIGAAGIDNG